METTYKIIGADGREYGPVSLAELKSWIHDGRLVGHTHVWRSDQTTWLPAAQYQELQPEIGQVSPTPASASAIESETVGFWPRLGAYLIDGVVLYSIFFIIWTSLAKTMDWHEPDFQNLNIKTPEELVAILAPALKTMLVKSALFYVWKILYDVSLIGRFGATIGKMVISARIVRLDGARIGYGIAFLRSVSTILSDMICYIGYLLVAFREDKRALHDLLAGTKVIYRR